MTLEISFGSHYVNDQIRGTILLEFCKEGLPPALVEEGEV
jgi:hypothetical protein